MNSIVNESTTQRQVGEGNSTNTAAPFDVVAALRRHEWVRIIQQAADLIEQQAERIKELEATLDRLYRVGHCGSVDSFLACDDEVKRGYFAMMVEESTNNKKLRKELAAIRKRIDDAPVVAHITEDGKVFDNGFVRDTDKPLISKEDLK